MPQITKISSQKKPGFFNIFVDGQFAFGLDEESLYKEKLKEGQEIPSDRLEELRGGVIFSKILNRVLNFLSFRPRSKKETLVYLQTKVLKALRPKDLNKTSNEETSGKVIKKLEEWGYLNDEEFARWLVEQRTSARNPKGPLALRQELFQKGIERELVERIVQQSSVNPDQETILKLLEKKDKKFHFLALNQRRQKLLASLISRGFEYATAQATVAQYLKGV